MEPTRKHPDHASQAAHGDPSSYDYERLGQAHPRQGGHWYATPAGQASLPRPVPPAPESAAAAIATQPHNFPAVPAPQPMLPPAPPSAAPTTPEDWDRASRIRQRIDARRRRRAAGLPENWAWVVIASALLGLTLVVSALLIFLVRYAMSDSGGSQAVALGPRSNPPQSCSPMMKQRLAVPWKAIAWILTPKSGMARSVLRSCCSAWISAPTKPGRPSARIR
ncbi:MAG: hypothetical protein HC915_06465 [Anaerolineae bacterium]|nr:hypothetical protein [Anaerolineae bacterium]